MIVGKISDGINILTDRDLDALKDKSFQAGVKRGAFEERARQGNEKVAMNCSNWEDGRCNTCGAQWQDFQVSKMHKCKNFTERNPS